VFQKHQSEDSFTSKLEKKKLTQNVDPQKASSGDVWLSPMFWRASLCLLLTNVSDYTTREQNNEHVSWLRPTGE
jgi:hypothetical protein